VSMARIIKWDVDPTGAFDRTLSPKEIMNKLEQRAMPAGNKPHRAPLSSSAVAHLDELLDEALEQTFPASDAVAIDIQRVSQEREARLPNRNVGNKTAQKH
jgi:hypothetical protein